jgi:uncharacterized protein (TIGR02271 family)
MDDRDTRTGKRTTPDDTAHVAALRDLDDFQVAEGFPDPRGWDVLGADGVKVGKVHDLIVDTAAMRTRYLDVELDKKAIGARDDRDVLIPVGTARLDDTDDRVILGSLSGAQLASLPPFDHHAITREYEAALLGAIPGAAAARADTASDYYSTKHFDDRQFFGTRRRVADAGPGADRDADRNVGRNDEARVTRSEEELDVGKRQTQAGAVDINKRVETEHVTQPVTLRREEVTIERRPVRADQAASDARIGDDTEVRIPLTEEELSVGKRAVVKEEIVVKKHMVCEDKNVEADLRKERIDIDRSGERGAPAKDNDQSTNR